MLALSAGAFAFCGDEDAEPSAPHAVVSAEEGPTAAPEQYADAGALLDAWASALQPLLERDGGPTTTAVWIHRSDAGATSNPFGVLLQNFPLPDGGRRIRTDTAGDPGDLPVEEADAGPACNPGPIRIALRENKLDLVVAIDTSGSMYPNMSGVNDWLTKSLTPRLNDPTVDAQLMVLVDLEDFRLMVKLSERRQPGKPGIWKPSDGGINLHAEVQSSDALDVLLESASQPSGWLSRLRPDAAVHVLVVTDDSPMPGVAEKFIERLTKLAGDRLGPAWAPKFAFHGLLGIETSAEAWVLVPNRPAVERLAACGVNPGVEYQAIAQATGGLRGSVCHPASMNAFVDGLIGTLRTTVRCDSALPPNFPVDRPFAMRAIGRDGRTRMLDPAFDRFNCEQSSAGYLVSQHQVRVCPKSCEALARDGYDVVEATGRCP